MDSKTVFSHVDHTLLKPEATEKDIDRVCREAVDNGMASACIPPRFVKMAKARYGNRLTVCTVVGFPLGYSTTRVKVFETQQAIADGADEIDMVIHIGDAMAGAGGNGDRGFVGEDRPLPLGDPQDEIFGWRQPAAESPAIGHRLRPACGLDAPRGRLLQLDRRFGVHIHLQAQAEQAGSGVE